MYDPHFSSVDQWAASSQTFPITTITQYDPHSCGSNQWANVSNVAKAPVSEFSQQIIELDRISAAGGMDDSVTTIWQRPSPFGRFPEGHGAQATPNG